MRTTGLFAAVATAALLAGCGIGAPAYPQFGQASYRIEGMTASPDGGAATHTVIYRDGSKMRVEATLAQQGEATIVFDQATNAAYVLSRTATGVTATPTPVPSAAPTTAPATTGAETPAAGRVGIAPSATPQVVTAPPSVIGVAVRIADADAPQPLETAWATLGPDNAKSAGKCEVAGESGHNWQPRENTAGIERTACITDDGIVLSVREDDRVIWEATSLQRGAQDAALFGIPAGYQLINPQAVAEQVGDQMEQLNSVSGAQPIAPSPAPVTAPPG